MDGREKSMRVLSISYCLLLTNDRRTPSSDRLCKWRLCVVSVVIQWRVVSLLGRSHLRRCYGFATYIDHTHTLAQKNRSSGQYLSRIVSPCMLLPVISPKAYRLSKIYHYKTLHWIWVIVLTENITTYFEISGMPVLLSTLAISSLQKNINTGSRVSKLRQSERWVFEMQCGIFYCSASFISSYLWISRPV